MLQLHSFTAAGRGQSASEASLGANPCPLYRMDARKRSDRKPPTYAVHSCSIASRQEPLTQIPKPFRLGCILKPSTRFLSSSCRVHRNPRGPLHIKAACAVYRDGAPNSDLRPSNAARRNVSTLLSPPARIHASMASRMAPSEAMATRRRDALRAGSGHNSTSDA